MMHNQPGNNIEVFTPDRRQILRGMLVNQKLASLKQDIVRQVFTVYGSDASLLDEIFRGMDLPRELSAFRRPAQELTTEQEASEKRIVTMTLTELEEYLELFGFKLPIDDGVKKRWLKAKHPYLRYWSSDHPLPSQLRMWVDVAQDMYRRIPAYGKELTLHPQEITYTGDIDALKRSFEAGLVKRPIIEAYPQNPKPPSIDMYGKKIAGPLSTFEWLRTILYHSKGRWSYILKDTVPLKEALEDDRISLHAPQNFSAHHLLELMNGRASFGLPPSYMIRPNLGPTLRFLVEDPHTITRDRVIYSLAQKGYSFLSPAQFTLLAQEDFLHPGGIQYVHSNSDRHPKKMEPVHLEYLGALFDRRKGELNILVAKRYDQGDIFLHYSEVNENGSFTLSEPYRPDPQRPRIASSFTV